MFIRRINPSISVRWPIAKESLKGRFQNVKGTSAPERALADYSAGYFCLFGIEIHVTKP